MKLEILSRIAGIREALKPQNQLAIIVATYWDLRETHGGGFHIWYHPVRANVSFNSTDIKRTVIARDIFPSDKTPEPEVGSFIRVIPFLGVGSFSAEDIREFNLDPDIIGHAFNSWMQQDSDGIRAKLVM